MCKAKRPVSWTTSTKQFDLPAFAAALDKAEKRLRQEAWDKVKVWTPVEASERPSDELEDLVGLPVQNLSELSAQALLDTWEYSHDS